MQGKKTLKIMRKVSKKRYQGKNVYTYERFYVPVPKQFHKQIEPFLNKSLDIQVKPKNGGFEIVCRPRENVSAPEKTPQKFQPKLRSNHILFSKE